jgi:hypothetical protein
MFCIAFPMDVLTVFQLLSRSGETLYVERGEMSQGDSAVRDRD